MTDGLYRDSTPMGDTRFLERKKIDPEAADRWREVRLERRLGESTETLARSFGYEVPSGEDDLHRRRREARGRRRASRPDRASG